MNVCPPDICHSEAPRLLPPMSVIPSTQPALRVETGMTRRLNSIEPATLSAVSLGVPRPVQLSQLRLRQGAGRGTYVFRPYVKLPFLHHDEITGTQTAHAHLCSVLFLGKPGETGKAGQPQAVPSFREQTRGTGNGKRVAWLVACCCPF
jgi:hypothetical protein